MSFLSKHRRCLMALLLVATTVVAYWPALHGGYIWDDNDHISENETLHSAHGLWQIWFQPGATCQYYPLTFTGFWAGYQLWGLNTLGYHLLNVLMHAVVALLFWQVLERLKARGAWLAGMLFALHPVCVMSVAWMTELKNTLSAALALGAGWAYMRFAGMGVYAGAEGANIQHSTFNAQHPGSFHSPQSTVRSPRPALWYVLALALFQLALFAKTAVSFLPVSLLLVTWWQRDRLRWRDLWPLIPMLGVVGAMGWLTFHIEHLHGATGQQFHMNFVDRVLVSGRSFWFYLGKLFWPHPLIFIYERWQVNAHAVWQCLFPAATILLFVALWLGRKHLGKGLFTAAAHFYTCTSLLILLTVLYMTRYTFVTDHWQYFGCMSVMAVVAAALCWNDSIGGEARPSYEPRSSRREEALTSSVEKAKLASPHVVSYKERGKGGRSFSTELFQSIGLGQKLEARIRVACCAALLLTLATLTWRQCHMYSDLETLWQVTLARNPRAFLAHNNYGELLTKRGDLPAAASHFQRAREIQPDFAEAHYNYGNSLLMQGRPEQASACFRRAIELQPDYAEAHNNLGNVLLESGHLDEAIRHFQAALQIQPDFAEANFNFAKAMLEAGKPADAVAHCRAALTSQPDNPDALAFLAWVLSTSPDAAVRDGARALEYATRANELSGGPHPLILQSLAAAYAENGRYAEALQTAQLAASQAGGPLVTALRAQIELYRKGEPFRDSGATNANSASDAMLNHSQ